MNLEHSLMAEANKPIFIIFIITEYEIRKSKELSLWIRDIPILRAQIQTQFLEEIVLWKDTITFMADYKTQKDRNCFSSKLSNYFCTNYLIFAPIA